MNIRILKETERYVEYETTYPNGITSSVTKEKKLLCIGGPFGGQRMAAIQLGLGYVAYNAASRTAGWRYRRKHTAIYVHETLFP